MKITQIDVCPLTGATVDGGWPQVNAATAVRLGLSAGQRVRIRQGGGDAEVELARDDRLADATVRLSAAHPSTSRLGGMFDELVLEPA